MEASTQTDQPEKNQRSGQKPVSYARPTKGFDRWIYRSEQEVQASKYLSEEELIFEGHYPHQPIFPGVVVVDCVVQVVRAHLEVEQGHPYRLSEVRSVRFKSPLFPGDTMTMHCRLEPGPTPNEVHVVAKCLRDDTESARVKLTLTQGRHHD